MVEHESEPEEDPEEEPVAEYVEHMIYQMIVVLKADLMCYIVVVLPSRRTPKEAPIVWCR